MSKVIQIVNDNCAWVTPFENVGVTVGMYPSDCLFVEAPDYVFEGWGYITQDDDGNYVSGDDRFVKPVAPEGCVYDDDTGEMVADADAPALLLAAQTVKQDENKELLVDFLANHPITWLDGKEYGVTMDDQTEIQLNLSQYQLQVAAGVETPVLEWHASHESCVAWTAENLSALILAISEHVYPWFRKMQAYKEEIYACTSKDDVKNIELVYKTDDELAAEEAESNNDDTVAEDGTVSE